MKLKRKLTGMGRVFWQSWGRELVLVLAIMIPFRSSIADWNHVPSGSMKPTILEGDRLLVNKLAYDLKVPLTTWHLARWGDPDRGDIIVFFSPTDGTRLVKRVIGLPGDTVAMRNGQLLLNGRRAEYHTLAMEVVESLSMDEREHHRFALETMDGIGHPVMTGSARRVARSFGPVTVPEGQYLVLGDNRDNSADSRVFGFVDRQSIVGKAPAVVISFNRENFYLPRWGRWAKRLP